MKKGSITTKTLAFYALMIALAMILSYLEMLVPLNFEQAQVGAI